LTASEHVALLPRWDERAILVLNGASTMGKSYLAKLVHTEVGAHIVTIDAVYTNAVYAAGMTQSPTQNAPETTAARRHARDRRWPSSEAKEAFFAAYQHQIQAALVAARDQHVPIVLEGGTLRHDAEADIVVRCAREVHGDAARVVRVTVAVPYLRWLENRVERALRSKNPVRLDALSEQRYELELRRSQPPARGDVQDLSIASVDDLRRVLVDLRDRVAA